MNPKSDCQTPFRRLECEYRADPCGIPVRPPVLSWQGPAGRVRIKDESGETLWDSGTPVDSPCRPDWTPAPCRSYFWTVECGNALAGGRFETAYPDGFDWTPARWIADPANPGTLKAPVSVFRRKFHLDELPADSVVRLVIGALGVYRAELNGHAVGDAVLAPGAVDFSTRTLYQTLPAEHLLHAGDNEIVIALAGGWHSGAIARFGEHYEHTFYATPDALIARLELRRPGRAPELLLASDASWHVSNRGPVRYGDLYMGEYFDGTRGDDPEGVPAREVAIDLALDAADGVPVRRVMELEPVAVTRRGDVSIVDFGQNFTGRERIAFSAPRGTEISVRHGEMLHGDGSLYTENLRTAEAATRIVAPGGAFTYEPEFTFYGFRYLEVRGVADFTVRSEVLCSDLAETMKCRTSDPRLDRFLKNALWSQRGNFLDIPTDCPQRDERRGWSGDAQVFAPAALFQMHAAPFFRKWLTDFRGCAAPDGGFPDFAPNRPGCDPRSDCGNSGWADAGVILPALLYLYYGDRAFLAENLAAIYRWIDLQAAESDHGLRCRARYGDWLNRAAPTGEALISTAYFAYGARLAARAARALGDRAGAERMEAHHALARAAFRRNFVTPEGDLRETTQCAAALALEFGLLEKEEEARAADFLARDIAMHEHHLTTGFLGTPLLLFALSGHGKLEEAYRLLLQTTCPSWLYPVTQGATTVWERWDSWSETDGFSDIAMNSFNHYAYGAAAAWVYEVAAGIRPLWERPGFREFVLAPRPGGTLTEVAVSFDSPAGLIRSAWRRMKGATEYNFTVPAGTVARLALPGEAERPLAPGEYAFRR